MKICTRCHIEKKITDFYVQTKNSKDGYQSHCKACDNARKLAWKKANPDLAKKHSKKSDSNKYLKNKEIIKKRNKKWKLENPAKLNAMHAKRRAVMLQRTPKWLSKSELLRIECLYSVAAMLTKHGEEPWHVDHIIPLQGKNVSGLHVYGNLRVVPSSQNLAKGNRFNIT